MARIALEQRGEIEAILKKPFVPINDKKDGEVIITKKLPVSLCLYISTNPFLFSIR